MMQSENNLPLTIGDDQWVSLLGGERVRFVNLDNTATTPVFVEVKQTVDDFLEWYGSVHRGSGHKSLVSTWLYEEARRRVGEYCRYDPAHDVVIFTNNTTHAINMLKGILKIGKDDIVLNSQIEHSSNELPWREIATRRRYGAQTDGTINTASVEESLKQYGSKVKLVAVTGASNVTGYIPPYYEIAETAHRYGAPIFVDCAQLAAHRPLDMLKSDDPRHLDFIAFSAHKMQAPFGAGALIGPRALLDADLPPDEPGGGTTQMCTEERVYWTPAPARFEAGTPNAVGAIALAKTLEVFSRYGMEHLADYEMGLWRRAVRKLRKMNGVTLYIDPDDGRARTPIIPFNIDGVNHCLTAAILGFEYGIGVRHGRHCADQLVKLLVGVSKQDEQRFVKDVVQRGKKTEIYGVVRASIGVCNREEDIDRFIEAVERISTNGPRFEYEPDIEGHESSDGAGRETGDYWPKGFAFADVLANAALSDNLLSLQNGKANHFKSPPSI